MKERDTERRRCVQGRRGPRPHQADFRDLRQWMVTDLCRFFRLADTVRDAKSTPNGYSFRLQTAAFQYRFEATEAIEDDHGSLSCVADSWDVTRKLSSGPLSKQTWDAILRDIVSLEIVPVNDVKPVKRSPAQVPFCTPEMVEMYGTRPDGEEAEEDDDEDPIET